MRPQNDERQQARRNKVEQNSPLGQTSARTSQEVYVALKIPERGTRLPLLEAVRLGISDIRMRGPRSLLTMMSIVLSIAFFVFLSSNASITGSMAGQGTGAQAHQFMVSWVSIIVCGVTITNTMIMSATGKFKEIGTMKCLGALDRHVIMIFLFEGLVLGVLGGAAGGLVGSLAGLLMGGFQFGFDKLALFPLQEILRHTLLGIMLALFLSEAGSVYPAYFAARLSPTEALRYES